MACLPDDAPVGGAHGDGGLAEGVEGAARLAHLAGALQRRLAAGGDEHRVSGFVALRTLMPMNLKLRLRGRPAGVGAYWSWVSVSSVQSIMRTSGLHPQLPDDFGKRYGGFLIQ